VESSACVGMVWTMVIFSVRRTARRNGQHPGNAQTRAAAAPVHASHYCQFALVRFASLSLLRRSVTATQVLFRHTHIRCVPKPGNGTPSISPARRKRLVMRTIARRRFGQRIHAGPESYAGSDTIRRGMLKIIVTRSLAMLDFDRELARRYLRLAVSEQKRKPRHQVRSIAEYPGMPCS